MVVKKVVDCLGKIRSRQNKSYEPERRMGQKFESEKKSAKGVEELFCPNICQKRMIARLIAG